MSLIHKIGKKIRFYCDNIKNEGIYTGISANLVDILGKIRYFLIFHTMQGSIGARSKVRGTAHMQIGSHFSAGPGLWLEAVAEYNGHSYSPQIIIGDHVYLSWNNHIGAVNYVKIGNHVLFGSNCYVTDHNHGIYSGTGVSSPDVPPSDRVLTDNKEVIIEDNVWIGNGVVILPGVTIGRGSIVGANSVVTKDIPSYTICGGIPARVLKKWNSDKKIWESENG